MSRSCWRNYPGSWAFRIWRVGFDVRLHPPLGSVDPRFWHFWDSRRKKINSIPNLNSKFAMKRISTFAFSFSFDFLTRKCPTIDTIAIKQYRLYSWQCLWRWRVSQRNLPSSTWLDASIAPVVSGGPMQLNRDHSAIQWRSSEQLEAEVSNENRRGCLISFLCLNAVCVSLARMELKYNHPIPFRWIAQINCLSLGVWWTSARGIESTVKFQN